MKECRRIKTKQVLLDLESIITFVFSGFSYILHLAHHLASLSKSLCRYSAAKLMFKSIWVYRTGATGFSFSNVGIYRYNSTIVK